MVGSTRLYDQKENSQLSETLFVTHHTYLKQFGRGISPTNSGDQAEVDAPSGK